MRDLERIEHERIEHEQRFRGSLITSLAVHVLTAAVLVFGPMILPRTIVMPDIMPVSLLPSTPAPPPAAAEEEPPPAEPEAEPETEPEPEPPVEAPPQVTESEPVTRSVEDIRREQQEAERQIRLEQERQRQREEELLRQQQEEAERRRQEEADRRRREEEERLRREEEARAAPQSAGRRPDPATQQSARRQAIDLTGTDENQTSFTVEDFPFAAYLLTIRDLVGNRWNPPERGQFAPSLRAEVFFRIGRDGRLTVTPRILDGSGNTIFDQAAMRAIASAAPFPPLPREYEGTSLGVRFAFVQE